MSKNNQIDLIEFPANSAKELKAAKKFFSDVFDWSFKDWGDEYADTQNSGVASGINAADPPSKPLAVIYSENLESTKNKIVDSGGKITKDTFAFPGGKRFHFRDPAGNELAVWSE